MPKGKSGTGSTHNIKMGERTFRGDLFSASTTRGAPLYVWVAAADQFLNSCYFCHGLSLGTYATHGYTVFSSSVWSVLQDEYDFLGFENGGTPQDLQVGDVVAWFAVKGGAVTMIPDITDGDVRDLPAGSVDVPVVEHSCVITALPGGRKQLSNIVVRSKNGFGDVYNGPLIGLLKLYHGRIGYYRRSAPVAPVTLFGANSIFAPPA